jgi:hypothetical protein
MSSNSCDNMEICLVVELMSSLPKKKKKKKKRKKCVYMDIHYDITKPQLFKINY